MIYDIHSTPISSTNLAIPPGTEKDFSVLIDCKSNYGITGGTSAAGVTVSGRADPADAWADIVSTPLDLTPYDGTRKQFYFSISVDAAEPAENSIVNIHVGPLAIP